MNKKEKLKKKQKQKIKNLNQKINLDGEVKNSFFFDGKLYIIIFNNGKQKRKKNKKQFKMQVVQVLKF